MWEELHEQIDADSNAARQALVDQINKLNEELQELDAERQKRHAALDFALGLGSSALSPSAPIVEPFAGAGTARNGTKPNVFPAARATRAFIKKKLKKGDVFDQRNVYNYFSRAYRKEVEARHPDILRSQISRALSNMAPKEIELVEEGKGGNPNRYKKL